MTPRVVVIGSLNMDLVALSPRIPLPGETIIGKEFHTIPGGKGANQAVAAARLGAQVAMVGRIGRDAFAEPLLHNLAASGIDHKYVIQDPEAATGVALIVVDDAGQNSIVVASGANMRLLPEHVDASETVIASAQVLIAQLEIPLATVIRAAELAKTHGVTVVLNPAPAQTLPDVLFSMVDVLIPNETETALLTGMPIKETAEIEAAAHKLRKSGVPTVILTLGGEGALMATADGLERYPAFDVTPVDTTAAGDAFVGGFAVALAEGEPLSQAVRFGNAAGASAVTKLGAQTSLPNRVDVEELLKGGAVKGKPKS